MTVIAEPRKTEIIVGKNPDQSQLASQIQSIVYFPSLFAPQHTDVPAPEARHFQYQRSSSLGKAVWNAKSTNPPLGGIRMLTNSNFRFWGIRFCPIRPDPTSNLRYRITLFCQIARGTRIFEENRTRAALAAPPPLFFIIGAKPEIVSTRHGVLV